MLIKACKITLGTGSKKMARAKASAKRTANTRYKVNMCVWFDGYRLIGNKKKGFFVNKNKKKGAALFFSPKFLLKISENKESVA